MSSKTQSDPKLTSLAAVEPFSGLTPGELRIVGATADLVRRPAGTELTHEGGYGSQCFVLLGGEVSVHDGHRTIAVLGPGSVVGERAVLDRRMHRTATVVADTEVTLAVFDVRSFQRLMAEVPAFEREVRRVVAERSYPTSV